MKVFLQILFSLLTVLSCSLFASGQRVIDIKPSILDEVRATSWSKKTEDFHLSGKVKQVEIVTNNLADTSSILQFNPNGDLIKEKTRDNEMEYVFDGSVLKEVKISFPERRFDNSVFFFNANGQLTRKEIIGKRDDELRKITVQYSYKKQWKKISLDYDYSYDISSWDVVLGDEYTLEFDSLDRVTVIYSKSRHPTTTYGATKNYGYDPKNGKLNHVSFVDDNAGSNSALWLSLGIRYNDEDSTLVETLMDFTVRNSLWTYSYSILKKQNSFGEYVELKNLGTSSPFDVSPINETIPEDSGAVSTYLYTTDSFGNWTERVAILPSGKKQLTKRFIQYY